MVLPSVADALIVIVLLIPGFIAFWMTKRIGSFNRPLSEFESSVWSFVFSAIILFLFTLVTQLSDIDLIREQFFYPKNFFALFIITGIVGLVGGGFFWVSNRNRTLEGSQAYALKLNDKYVREIQRERNQLKNQSKDGIISGEEQKKLNEKTEKTILTVYTKDNQKFGGRLLHSTDNTWDILIGKVNTDEKWERLLIKGEDITRIFFYSPDDSEQQAPKSETQYTHD